ncbi:MAG: hypothetical protein ACRDZW_05190, partial [Acidimicrobiales bacterium]
GEVDGHGPGRLPAVGWRTVADLDDIRSRLERIAEDLADLAYDALRAQAAGDTDAVEVERRLAKARRAVERAVAALGRTSGEP